MSRDVGMKSLDEVAEDSLIRLRDEEVRGVVVGREDFLLRESEMSATELSEDGERREMTNLDDAYEHPEGVLLGRMSEK
jgi:hypothetical protein